MKSRSLGDLIRSKVKKTDEPTPTQSKHSSLMMNASKSIRPLLINELHNGHGIVDLHKAIAGRIQSTFDSQKSILAKVSSTVGGFMADESFIWRRSFHLAASQVANGSESEIDLNIMFALIRNDPESKSLCKRLGIDQPEFLATVQSIVGDNRYTDKSSFYRTIASTEHRVALGLKKAISKTNWQCDISEVYRMATRTLAIVTKELYTSQPTLPNTNQQKMLLKSSISHASSIVCAALTLTAEEYNGYVHEIYLDEFEEKHRNLAVHTIEILNYCNKLAINTLLQLEEKHTGVSAAINPNTSLKVSEVFDCLNLCQQLKVPPNHEQHNVYASNIVTSLKRCHELSNYMLFAINDYLCDSDSQKVSNFAHKVAWSAISDSIGFINSGGYRLGDRHIKSAINMVVYMLSEENPDNEVLNRYGANPSEILACRKARDRAYAISLHSPMQYRQVVIPTVAELSRALVATNAFSWGLSTAFIAAQVAEQILIKTDVLFIHHRDRVGNSNATSLFQSVLHDATDTFIQTWTSEASRTLSQSKISYARGEIGLEDSNQLLTQVFGKYNHDIAEHIRLSDMVTQQHREQFPELSDESVDSEIAGNPLVRKLNARAS